MYLPVNLTEARAIGWDQLDIILVSGDSYIDSPFIGIALLGKILVAAGFRVGIIAQPDMRSGDDITRLGEPRLFWGVTAGSVDSMVANYTALKKKRQQDDYTPGGINNRRPDRACIAYTNLIRRHFKPTVPIVLGGIEASLRRVAHYDFWDNRIRRSVLVDAKADYLLYGMAERSIVELACALRDQQPVSALRGLCFLSREIPAEALELPAYETVADNTDAFTEMFHTFYKHNDPLTAKPLAQKHGDRYLIQQPPAHYLSEAELDAIYTLPFERELHPAHRSQGAVRALDTIRFSVATHQGCYGECNFCAIAVHQGRTVRSRSAKSIESEVQAFTHHPKFRGIVSDVGGPTANMYGYECKKKLRHGSCQHRRCLVPQRCEQLPVERQSQRKLLERLRKIPGVKKIFVASGIRHDLILEDKQHGLAYLETLVEHHVSGQMKIAPEHTEPKILELMGKPAAGNHLEKFCELFASLSRKHQKQQFLTYYFIAAHPGCDERAMEKLQNYASRVLHIQPEQVQIFTPTPSTYSSLMYYTGKNPFTGEKLFSEKNMAGKERQKMRLQKKSR